MVDIQIFAQKTKYTIELHNSTAKIQGHKIKNKEGIEKD